MRSPDAILGVVLAGGESSRFDGEKALFPLGGKAMARWSLEALEPSSSSTAVVTNDPETARALGVPGRPDLVAGLGPLGGLLTALTWAAEDGLEWVFLLACDLPLVGADLVARIVEGWPEDAPAVVPGSHGPLGFEPLCGGYGVGCLPAVQEVAASSRRSMDLVLSKVGAHRILPDRLGTPEELAAAFLNVNTRDAALRAEGLLGGTT